MSNNIKYILNNTLPLINKDFKGNIQIDGEFSNFNHKQDKLLPKVLKWRFTKNPDKKKKQSEVYKLKVIHTDFLHLKDDCIVWLGHSSFFIRIAGKNILTDPVLFDLPLIPRKAGLPISPEELVNIDYLLLSHGHRDHFDSESLKVVFKLNPGIKVLTSLNMSTLIKDINKEIKVQEAGWYQQYIGTNDITFTFLPARHWHRRGLFDFNKVLWGSFMIKAGEISIFFCGDSAYGPHFSEIQKFFPETEYCLMPIGAYKPSFMMQGSHTSPEEAFQAFKDLKGRYFIPMHYGTYDLSDELLGEPEAEIRRIFKEAGRKDDLVIKGIGEIIKI